MIAKKLYIIGNGFDRYHELETRYQAFAIFLQDKYPETYETLITYYNLPDLDRNNPNDFNDPKWAEFEKALAEIDSETLLDDNSDYLPNVGSDDFRDRDWHAFQQVMSRIVDDLTGRLFDAFKEFILAVKFPPNIDDKKLCLNRNAQYLTFNYTDTLERYYNIPQANILYIHNKASTDDAVLILGHGIDPKNFRIEEQKQPEGLSEEEVQQWMEYMSDNYDYSYESGKEEMMSYFVRSFKETAEIIAKNSAFFESISAVSHVVVLGHSLSEVDMPYIQAVYNAIRKGATWSVSYYSDKEKNSHLQTLTKLPVGNDRIRLFKMPSLKKNIWNCFTNYLVDLIAYLRSNGRNA